MLQQRLENSQCIRVFQHNESNIFTVLFLFLYLSVETVSLQCTHFIFYNGNMNVTAHIYHDFRIIYNIAEDPIYIS